MKKNLMLFLALVLVVGCALLVACGGDDPADTTAPATSAPATSAPATSAPATSAPAPSVLGSVTLADATATYDGTAKTIAVAGAPADATVSYTVNGEAVAAVSVTDAGTYTVVATVSAGSETVTKTATLTITKADYTLPAGTEYFADATVVYDGQYHTPAALVALPEGLTFTADGAPVINAGDTATYVISFTFSDAAMAKNYNAPAAIEGIELTVLKADIDVSGVVFDDLTVPFDGAYHQLTVSNVPAQLSCTVSRGGIARGTYPSTATFSFKNAADKNNYNLPAPLTATLTIGAGYITMPQFGDKTLPYNGANRVPVVPAIEGIASSTVVIKNADGEVVDEAKAVGTYTIEISFTVADTAAYQPVDPITYTLTITKATIAGLEAPIWGPETAWDVETENGGYFVYADGVAHAVKANLPAAFIGHNTTVTYTHRLNGQIVTDTSLPGLYTTTATITLNSDTYILPEDYTLGSFTWLVADKEVDADAIDFDIADKTYDGTALDFGWSIDGVAGLVSSTYVLYDAEGNAITEAVAVGTYKIVITFTTDAANGYAPLTVEKTVAITAAEIDLSGIVAAWDHPLTEGKPFFYYDGAMKTVKLTDATVAALAELGVTVSGYTNNAKAETGDYVAVANLVCDGNFVLSQDTFEFAWGIATPDDDVWSDVTVK